MRGGYGVGMAVFAVLAVALFFGAYAAVRV
jgi:hypothetical protein